MDTNLAAWITAGGPHIEAPSVRREREHLLAIRDRQRRLHAGRPGLVDRLRGIVSPTRPEADLVCCTA